MIDSPPRKRDPLQLAAKLARMSNDISLTDTEAAAMKDAAVTLRYYHDALSRLGITMGQMEADAIGRLVEVAKEIQRICKCEFRDIDACPMNELAEVLKPFTK